MFAAGKLTVPFRKRGPKGLFTDPARQRELVVFLLDPAATTAEAAKHFGCSISLIEKQIQKLRKDANPTKSDGPAADDRQDR